MDDPLPVAGAKNKPRKIFQAQEEEIPALRDIRHIDKVGKGCPALQKHVHVQTPWHGTGALRSPVGWIVTIQSERCEPSRL